MSEVSTSTTYPNLFPGLEERAQSVAPGDYELLDGSDVPQFYTGSSKSAFIIKASQAQAGPFPGLYHRGTYNINGVGSRWAELDEQIVSFKYRESGDSKLETHERVVVPSGIGFGVRPEHSGQEPNWYLVGLQIGTIKPANNTLVRVPMGGVEYIDETPYLRPKHFSIALIVDGPFGNRILANPA